MNEIIKPMYFHSKLNSVLIIDKTNERITRLIKKELRLKELDIKQKVQLMNLLDSCGTTYSRRMTVCGIIHEDKCYIGIAICSELDNFSRKIGREKSYEEAMHESLDILDNWIERCNDQFEGNSNRAFIAYCNEIAIPSYLNNEEYRKEKGKQTIMHPEVMKVSDFKIDPFKKNWFQKLFNL